jgi:uncharacterized membrane protein YraQ (UPF0718 family)
MDHLITFLQAVYAVCLESGWWVLFGVAVAGILHVFLRAETLARHLGKRSAGSVFKASAIGIPLPLCSCSVIPVATGLKRKGAGNPAVASFMISTPENGVDSIALSWALLGPWLTLFRVVASFFTAVVAGLAELMLNSPRPDDDSAILASGSSCCSTETPPAKSSCCGSEPEEEAASPCCSSEESQPRDPTFSQRFWSGQRYAFGDLFKMLAPYFFYGILLTGLIAALIPESFFQNYTGGGIAGMLVMLGIGIPIYVCASGSTPLVAGLIAMGMSPGTALVLLLAGPATNIATMAVVRGMMGTFGLVLYVGSIAVCSIAAGLAVDAFWGAMALGRPVEDLFHQHGAAAGPLMHLGAIIFIALTLWGTFELKVKPLLRRRAKGEASGCH